MTAALLADLASSLDPVELARRLGIELYAWQTAALRSVAARACWVVTRQGGKSTAAALLALHAALFRPGSTVLMASPGLRQSSELYLKARSLYRQLGRPAGSRSEAATSLELESGSRIIAVPGSSESTIRAYAADLLLVDEASRLDPATWDALRPMVAVTGGRIVLLSTPWGAEGFFWEAATGRDPGWEVTTVPATEIPTIDPLFLERERLSMGPSAFDREYGCSFEALGAGLWSAAQVEALLDPAVQPLFPRGAAP
jgi:hypothetical protein